MRRQWPIGFAAALLLAPIGSALASFHFIYVVEVYPGSPAAPNAQYVMVQMYSGGQNFVGGIELTVHDATGLETGSFQFTSSVANGSDQSKILIATPEAQAFFNVTPNLLMTPVIARPGGKVCWSTIDCVAWGNYTGDAAGVGAPFNATGLPAPGDPRPGLQFGRAMARRLDISGVATILDIGDDTNQSSNDFRFVTPAPRNNAGQAGVIPPSVCGNGIVQSLEQCDDGNARNGDGCSTVCLVDSDGGVPYFRDGFEDP